MVGVHAERRRRFVVGSGLAATGLLLLPVWSPLAIVATFAGVLVARPFTNLLNVWWTRAHYMLLVLCHAGSVWLGTRSIALAAASVLFLAPPVVWVETTVKRFGYGALWAGPLGIVAGLVAVVCAWRLDVWLLAVLPSFVAACQLGRNIQGVMKRLRASGRARWGVNVGDLAPEVHLRTRDGRSFRLSDERGRFVLLVFMRSDWCPVCHVQMRVYQKESETLARHGVKIVAVGQTKDDDSLELSRILGVDFETVVDHGCRVAERFGAVQTNTLDGVPAALPASFLIGPDGRVRYSTRSDHIGEFAAPARLIEVLSENAAVAAA